MAKVIFVGAGPGDPELLTLKAHRLLTTARCCIYAGSLIAPEVIALLPEDCAKYDSAALDLSQTHTIIREHTAKGIDVIRLHTGDPAIYGAIAEQIRLLDRDGIAYECVPGISSFQAATAALKVELTAPEVSQTIILSRVAGRTPVPAEQELEQLAATRATLCLFLSIHKIDEICRRLIPFYGEQCPAAVVFHASWPDQKVIRADLKTLPKAMAGSGITRTALILVGEALRHGGRDSKLYDPTFSHGWRQGRDES